MTVPQGLPPPDDFQCPGEVAGQYDKIADWFMANFGPEYGMAYLQRLTDRLRHGARVIDLGCGYGRMTARLVAQGFRVVGVDLSARMTALARERVPEAEIVLADALDYRPEHPADAVVAWDSLFHLPYDRHRIMVGRLARLVRLGGYLLFTCGGVDGWVTGMMNGERFDYSSLSADEFQTALVQSGFRIVFAEHDQLPHHHMVILAVRER